MRPSASWRGMVLGRLVVPGLVVAARRCGCRRRLTSRGAAPSRLGSRRGGAVRSAARLSARQERHHRDGDRGRDHQYGGPGDQLSLRRRGTLPGPGQPAARLAIPPAGPASARGGGPGLPGGAGLSRRKFLRGRAGPGRAKHRGVSLGGRAGRGGASPGRGACGCGRRGLGFPPTAVLAGRLDPPGRDSPSLIGLRSSRARPAPHRACPAPRPQRPRQTKRPRQAQPPHRDQ